MAIIKFRVIAIDLDNTIWTEEFPNMGIPFPNAIETINEFIENKIEVVIWSARHYENIKECVYYLIDVYDLNPNVKVNIHSNIFVGLYDYSSPKVSADLYLDDKALNAPDFSKDWIKIRDYVLKG